MEIQIPYGRSYITAAIPDHIPVDVIRPDPAPAAGQPIPLVKEALDSPLGGLDLSVFTGVESVGIAINDKTRPVPHQHLLPPLLEQLEKLGIPDQGIRFYIAVGTHPPLKQAQFEAILPPEILDRYQVVSHDSEDQAGLIYLGQTSRGTEVWSNKEYVQSDLKIVVGNIDLHQFAGYSGGVKSAAIGLAGFDTITHNHSLMAQPGAEKGEYHQNPVRQDIEEIGQLMGIDLALSAILNPRREIVKVLAGRPREVMEQGLLAITEISQVPVSRTYDLVISSPGGHPKDIDVYQSQKALPPAAKLTSPGGIVIIAAACPEGSGNPHFEEWMTGKESYADVRAQFQSEGFRIGPHKAFMFARDAEKVQFKFYSELESSLAEKLLLNPIENFQRYINEVLADLGPGACVGVIPQAVSTVPFMTK